MAGHLYIANTERGLSEDSPATGNSAAKIIELSPRDIWRYRSSDDIIVMPVQPDSAFSDYAGELGWQPQVIVPEGVDLRHIDIHDGLPDPRVQAAVAGRNVQSFVADARLYRYVKGHGGDYLWGNPDKRPLINTGDQLDGDTVQKVVSNKANFRPLSQGIVEVPDGVHRSGLEAITHAVNRRLQRDGAAFVRNTNSGGGFGNVHFDASDVAATKRQLAAKLTGGNPEVWQRASALVEAYDPPAFSPSLTMEVGDTRNALHFHGLQLCQDSKYVGIITPTPESILNDELANKLAQRFISRLGSIGYQGFCGVDLGVIPGSTGTKLVGYEFNGRMTGSMHPVAIGEGLWGSWCEWRRDGHVVKAVDRFHLRQPLDFWQLHATLHEARLLASTNHPYGAVITIPPTGNYSRIAGIQILAKGYRSARRTFQAVIDLVGDRYKNYYGDTAVGESILK